MKLGASAFFALSFSLSAFAQTRNFVCAPFDDTGSPLIPNDSNVAQGKCRYQTAGSCNYFIENGTFSSGASTCPSSLVPPHTTGATGPPAPSSPELADDEEDEVEEEEDVTPAHGGQRITHPNVHRVLVGPDGKFIYGRENTTARLYAAESGQPNITTKVGDYVEFRFFPKNHTVTQSSFENPCTSLKESTGVDGFKSGFRPVPNIGIQESERPTFIIRINDTKPIWGYCGQVNHCSAGMVFSINAVENSPKNFAAFLARAKQTSTTDSNPVAVSPPRPSPEAPAAQTAKFACPPTDKRGSPLQPVKPRFKLFVKCRYPETGQCTYLARTGENIIGRSSCPDSLQLAAEEANHDGNEEKDAIVPVHGGQHTTGPNVHSAKKTSDTTDSAPQSAATGPILNAALDVDGEASSTQESKDILRNTYILIGIVGVLVIVVIVLLVLVIGYGGLKGRSTKRPGSGKYQRQGELDKLEESLSFTHPPTRYSD